MTLDPSISHSIFQQIETEIRESLIELAERGSWRNYEGPEIEQLQQALSQQFQQAHVHLCSSGTYSVELALRGLKVGAGDQVLLSAFDFPGNFRAVEAVGAIPVLLDLDSEQWFVRMPAPDMTQAKAIILSPLYGSVPNIIQYHDWCHKTDTRLLLDCCQCPGAKLVHSFNENLDAAPVPLSVWADATCLSFGGSKILSSGRGGAVITDDPGIAQRLRVATDRGNDISPLSVLQAAVLLPQVIHLNNANRVRSQLVDNLSLAVNELGVLLDPWMTPDTAERKIERVYYKKAWLAPNSQIRDEILTAANAQFPMGRGFRGFAKRSRRRCLQIGEMQNAIRSSETVVLLDHQFFTDNCKAEKFQLKKQELCEFLGRFG